MVKVVRGGTAQPDGNPGNKAEDAQGIATEHLPLQVAVFVWNFEHWEGLLFVFLNLVYHKISFL